LVLVGGRASLYGFKREQGPIIGWAPLGAIHGRAFEEIYAERIAEGRYAIYTIGDTVMVGLRRAGKYGVWKLDQIYDPRNTDVADSIKRRVAQWL